MVRRILIAGVIGFVASTAMPSFGFSNSSTPLAHCRHGGVNISRVRYMPPSSVHHGLNGERIVITNHSSNTKHLRGWSLRDSAGNVYSFPRTKLSPGRSVTVHTGHGKSHGQNRYWNRNRPAWRNTGDQARLRNRNGGLVDTCTWAHGNGSKIC